jgi:hypothetical protein
LTFIALEDDSRQGAGTRPALVGVLGYGGVRGRRVR